MAAKKTDKTRYVWGGVLLGAGLLWWIARKKYVGENLDVQLANLDQIQFSAAGVTGSFTVIITNPTSGSIKVQYPYIRYHLNDKFLGNSTPKDELIPLEAHKSVEIPIELNIYGLQALTTIGEIISAAQGQPLTLKIGVKTGIELTDLPEQSFDVPIVQ